MDLFSLIGNSCGLAPSENVCRDGTNFRYILNYMRTGELKIPDEYLLNELLTEAEFYMLTDLCDTLKKFTNKVKFFKDTTLLNDNYAFILNEWCNCPNQNWRLLYKVREK